MGTFSSSCTTPNHREPKRASSRANDQVIREAVWCTALIATQEMVKREAMKIVTAMGELVACVQMV